MAKRVAVGIDVGTYQVKVVVVESSSKGEPPKIIGAGFSESKGLRHGYIINTKDITRSIRAALEQAEKASGVRIRKAYLSIGGVGLDEVRARGEMLVMRADREVTDLDIEKAFEDAERKTAQKTVNRKILHSIPVQYRIDGETVLGRPQGMKGSKLEINALFITCLEQHLHDLIQSVEDAKVEVIDVMASPLAGSLVTLNKTQKIVGCILINIGSETVSVVIFENSMPISLKVFPIGSTDITNDIALGLKVSLEEAEQIKRGAITHTSFPKKKLDDIVLARLSDIFELIEAHLKDIGKNGLLPAGIMITGGGSGIATIEDLARAALRLPSKTLSINSGGNSQIKDSTWAVAYGLCIWGLSEEETPMGIKLAKKTGGTIVSWVRQFLP
jgi:cell division protein FtsA|tara:strand:+ start:8196 stop:9356 length:1161 start_codon:yes stop_codon:yes gene_type:complete